MYIVFNQARKQIFFRLFFYIYVEKESKQTEKNWDNENKRERQTERERYGRDIYKSSSNEIYRHVFIRGKEKTKGRCHHHHNEQYGTNSTWLIAIHVWLPTELLAKLCQKSSECLDTIILSITGPETNIFMTSCTQADLASQFLVCNFLLRQHKFWLQQLKEFIYRSIKIKNPTKIIEFLLAVH